MARASCRLVGWRFVRWPGAPTDLESTARPVVILLLRAIDSRGPETEQSEK